MAGALVPTKDITIYELNLVGVLRTLDLPADGRGMLMLWLLANVTALSQSFSHHVSLRIVLKVEMVASIWRAAV